LNPEQIWAYGRPGAPGWDPDEHEVDRWCRLVAAYGCRPRRGDLYLAAAESGRDGPAIVHPGAAEPSRRWPAERFAAVVQGLLRRGLSVRVTAGPGENALAAAVANQAGLPVGSIASDLDLSGLTDLVATSPLVVCGDTGIAHLATACRTPSVVLFGPQPPSRWGPPADDPRHRVFYRRHHGPTGDGPHPGLLWVRPGDVLAAADEVLQDLRFASSTAGYGHPMPTEEQQQPPGHVTRMEHQPDHGEDSYRGCGRLTDKRAVITGADSGIGRAVAIAFAREGADVVIAYLDEHDDAKQTARYVEDAGRRAVLVAGDLSRAEHCQSLIDRAVGEFGGIDILVNNAAYQMTHENLEDITDQEWRYTFAVNVDAMFLLCRAAVPHMGRGASIINTTSINSDQPKPTLLPYATTKGAIANFSAGLAQLLGPRGIRVNSVAPGPIWTPLIPSTMPAEHVKEFGQDTPLGRPGQPAELAPAYVLLASDEASYISGARIEVTGGRPVL
jgi:NAD(P)-dependent dehydrogenase (short-subunit alcohol dehydrogenase family)